MLSTIAFHLSTSGRRRIAAIAVAVAIAAVVAIALLAVGGAEQLNSQGGDEVIAGASWGRRMMMLGASWS